MAAKTQGNDKLDSKLRLYIYRHFVRKGAAPRVAEMATALSASRPKIKESLSRLAQGHAILLQENGELWRAAPFSAVATAFPVQVGKKRWWANCIWDALGIPAMLHEDGQIDASCACCNLEMVVKIKGQKLATKEGIIHFAVPARNWYDNIVFT
jgi:hypothetical protein